MFTKIFTSFLLFLIAIGGFFVNISTNLKPELNITNAFQNARTDGGVAQVATSEAESKWLNEGIQAVNAALGILTVIVSPAIIFAGWLMSPDWTSGDLFGLREPMYSMWIIVSNIVYFIYAILLILIALATIFGKENFSYKAMIPKLALGILMVPFTWWFVQWTISLATVVTASVINIPMDMIKEDNKFVNGNYIPLVYTTTTDASGNSSTTDIAEELSYNNKCNGGDNDTDICTSIQKILNAGGGIYSPLLIYAYQVFRLQDYKSIDGTLNQIKTGGQLLNQIFIGAIMFIVFGLLVMALIAMLLLRAIKLWMYAIFSPIFTLHFVAGKELFGKSTEGFDLKEFIGLCFVPAVVGLTLSFGLMIISVVGDSNSKSETCGSSIKITNPETGEGGCTVLTLFGNDENKVIRGVYSEGTPAKEYSMTVIKMAGLTHIYKGSATNANSVADSANSIKGGLDAAGGIFGTIIVDIIALIFIWMAFMAGKGVSKAVEAAVSPFEDMGKTIGQMAMSAPKYIPIPGTSMSVNNASKALDQAKSIISQIGDQNYKKSDLGKLIQSLDPSQKLSDELNANTIAVRGATEASFAAKKGKEMANQATGEQMRYNIQIRDALDKFMQLTKTKQNVLISEFGSAVGEKMHTVINSNLDEEKKRILVSALMKGMDHGKVEINKLDQAVSSAEHYLKSAGGGAKSTDASGGLKINITNTNGTAEYSLGNLKYNDKNKFINAIKGNDSSIQNIKTEDIAEALKASNDFKNEADKIIEALKKERGEQ